MFTCQIDPSLEMRLWEDHHAEEMFRVVDANREHLRRWLPWVDASRHPDDARAFVRRALEQFARHDGFHAGIWLSGQIVGAIGLHYINWRVGKTEIGYWLTESGQGQGIMTRACRALINYVFGELKLNRVEIICASGNQRSRAVPTRLGFTEEGMLRQAGFLYDHHVDHVIYGSLAGEWKASGG